jgi:acyl-CoA dehydrogenase
MQAASQDDLAAFDKVLMQHIGFVCQNKVRAFVLGLTGSRLAASPRTGPTAQYYRDLSRLSAAFAYVSDVSMLVLGGSLKFKEKLSARLGDMLSNLYIASACLKKFEDDGRPEVDLPLVQWAVETAFHDFQEAMQGLLSNMPKIGCALHFVVFPLGRHFNGPSDKIGTQVARILMNDNAARDRLLEFFYEPDKPEDSVYRLKRAFEASVATEPLEVKLRRAKKEGKISGASTEDQLDSAVAQGVLSEEEKTQLQTARWLKREAIMVDEFDEHLDHPAAEIRAGI